MIEISPRLGLPQDLPKEKGDLKASEFHLALKESDTRGGAGGAGTASAGHGQASSGTSGTSGSGTSGTSGNGTSGAPGMGGTGPGVPGMAEFFPTGRLYPSFLRFETGGRGAPGGGGGAGSAAGFGASKPELSKGSKGADVQTAEDQVNAWRAENGRKPIKADGKYNQETANAVRDFQKVNKLKIDGIIGPNTHDRLQLENDASFKTLDPATKTLVRDQMNANQKNQAGRESALQLAIDPNLAKLPPDAQQNYVKKLGANPADLQQVRDNVKDRATLEKDPNFQKLDAVTQKNIREQIEKYDGQPVERGQLLKLATDPNFEKLGGAANRDRALKALAGNPASAANLTNLQKMIGSDSFQKKMGDGFRGQILDRAAAHAGDTRYIQDLSKLASDPKFGALNPVEQGKTLNVFEKTTPAGRTALQDLLQREVNGVSALKTHGIGKNAPTLLDNLDRLASSPTTDARLVDSAGNPVTPAQYSEQLLQEVSAPDNFIDQSNRGTCTCTSISHKLAAKNPAEYARIATDLALTGQSKLANGAAISVPGPTAWQGDNSTRSHSERLIQSSLMNYARPGKTYINNQGTGGTSVDGWADRPGGGLTSNEEERVMEGLYNKSVDVYDGEWNFRDDKKDIVNKIRGELGRGVSHVNVDLDWGSGGHAVEVVKVENGRVFFRNPHGTNGVGATGTNQGTAANNTNSGPLRRTEDSAKAIQSMTLADFEKAVRQTYVDG